MVKTNYEIYQFADDQIEGNTKKIPKDEWQKWLEEKEYTESDIKEIKKNIYEVHRGKKYSQKEYDELKELYKLTKASHTELSEKLVIQNKLIEDYKKELLLGIDKSKIEWIRLVEKLCANIFTQNLEQLQKELLFQLGNGEEGYITKDVIKKRIDNTFTKFKGDKDRNKN